MTFAGRAIEILPTDGFNNGFDAVNIGAKQTPDCRNVRFRSSNVKKREGSSRFVDTPVAAAPITGIFESFLDDGTTDVIAFASTVAARKNGAVWSAITGAMTISAGAVWQAAQLANVLVATNNANQLVSYAGGATNLTATTGASVPTAAKAITEYHNYLLLLNTLEGGVRRLTRCRFSDLNAATFATAASFFDILNAGGQTGLAWSRIGDQLYAFLSGSIWQVSYTGDDVAPFTNAVAHPSIGAVSAQGIVEVDGKIFFAAKRGIYEFTGGTPRYISQPVEGIWRTLNKSRLSAIVAVLNERDNEVRFSVSTGSSTTHDVTLVFDYTRETWAVDDGYSPTYWANLPETLPLQPVFGDANGRVMKTNTEAFLDDATAITAYCKTKPNDFGDISRTRKCRKLILVVDTSSDLNAMLTLRTGYDLAPTASDATKTLGQGSAVFDTAVFDVDTFAQEGQAIIGHYPGGHGEFFQAEVRNAQPSIGMTVSRLAALVKGAADE